MSKYHYQLDTSGLLCPLPILKARQQLNKMQVGEVLQVISSDKNALLDFQAFAQATNHQLLDSYKKDNNYYFLIKKS